MGAKRTLQGPACLLQSPFLCQGEVEEGHLKGQQQGAVLYKGGKEPCLLRLVGWSWIIQIFAIEAAVSKATGGLVSGEGEGEE